MSFSAVEDRGVRAACELLQEVVGGLLERTGAGPLEHLAISKRELARRAGVGQATLWPLLQGQIWPRLDTLMRIAEAADVAIGVL